MTSAILVPFFIFGAIIGSFLNVVIFRYNTGRSVGGRSACFSCGKTLRWYELVPIASFVVQRGRCARCRSVISPQYPIVEVVSAIIFLLIGWDLFSEEISSYRTFFASYEMIVWSLLIVISAYDMRHKIIPDGLVYAFIALSVVSVFGFRETIGGFSLEYFLTGLCLAAFPAILWLVSRGRWMGLGDAKLLLGAGFLLGPTLGVSALVYAFWSGAVVSVFLLSVKGKGFTMKSEIPFGPFIILGMAIAYFFDLNLFSLLL